MRQNFKTVRHVKPTASRSESVESYVLATGFHGNGLADMPAHSDDSMQMKHAKSLN